MLPTCGINATVIRGTLRVPPLRGSPSPEMSGRAASGRGKPRTPRGGERAAPPILLAALVAPSPPSGAAPPRPSGAAPPPCLQQWGYGQIELAVTLRTAACGSANGAGSHQAKRGRGWCGFGAKTRQKPFLWLLGSVCLAWCQPEQGAIVIAGEEGVELGQELLPGVGVLVAGVDSENGI